MGETKLEKQKKKLVDAGLMTAEDNLIDFLQASYVERLIGKMGKCSQSLLPIGITITHENAEKGKVITDRISMMKRDKWLELLSSKSGVTVS